jgi:hypothetical protein
MLQQRLDAPPWLNMLGVPVTFSPFWVPVTEGQLLEVLLLLLLQAKGLLLHSRSVVVGVVVGAVVAATIAWPEAAAGK